MSLHLPVTVATIACILLGAAPASAQLNGTLFTSPEQREYLDYLRQDFLARSSERGFDINEADIPDIPVAAAAAAEAEVPVSYTLGGIVTLRDGTRRIWLNGKALSQAQLPPEARLVNDAGTLALRFTTERGTWLLRPGQTLEPGAGSVMENYQRPPEPEAAAVADDEDSAAAAAAPATLAATDADASTDAAGAGATPTGAAPETAPADIAPTQESIDELRNLLDTLQAQDQGSDG